MSTLDVGAGRDPDPRADETLDIQPPADHVADLETEWPFESDSYDQIIASHVVEHLRDLPHFFHEAGRVLRAHGRLEVTVPLGEDAITDHDHQTVWTHATPEQFSQRHKRAWDPAVPFVLVDRELEVWSEGPEGMFWNSRLVDVLAGVAPGWVAYRCRAGELTATYRHIL